MIKDNLRAALRSIRVARWRSLFTMTGIIIGVAAVVTIVSLGEGVKKQVQGQINQIGADLIVIRPGKALNRDNSSGSLSLLSSFGVSNISESDLEQAKKVPGVKTALPLTLLNGLVSDTNNQASNGLIIATSGSLPDVLNQQTEYGAFFRDADDDKATAVIGRNLADNLYREASPIGRVIRVRGHDFKVTGVLEKFENDSLAPGAGLNSAVFIPYAAAKEIVGGPLNVNEVLVRTTQPELVAQTAKGLKAALIKNHGGQEDFTVLTQSESLEQVNQVVDLLTSMIAGIAAISLLVGGIGIMNIMLLVVTERSHEIGIRKAIGASNRQVLAQFLSEAMVLSFWGGIIGVFVAGIINYCLRVFTNLQPVITLAIVLQSVCVAVFVGIIFGVIPALKAARKSPIDALRTL